MTRGRTLLAGVLLATLLVFSTTTAAEVLAVIPNPAGNAAFAAYLGDMTVSEPYEGFVTYRWTCFTPISGWTDPQKRAEENAAIRNEHIAMRAAYQADCEAAGYASVGEEVDENGVGFSYFGVEDTVFALYMDEVSVQLMIPASAKLSAPRETSTPFVPILPDPDNNWYVRGTYNGKDVTFRLTGVKIKEKNSAFRFIDVSNVNDIRWMLIEHLFDFKPNALYRVDQNTCPPGLTVSLVTHKGDSIVLTERGFADRLSESDFVEFRVTKTGTNPALIGGTLSFSLGNGAYVLENGEFLGYTEQGGVNRP